MASGYRWVIHLSGKIDLDIIFPSWTLLTTNIVLRLLKKFLKIAYQHYFVYLLIYFYFIFIIAIAIFIYLCIYFLPFVCFDVLPQK